MAHFTSYQGHSNCNLLLMNTNNIIIVSIAHHQTMAFMNSVKLNQITFDAACMHYTFQALTFNTVQSAVAKQGCIWKAGHT